MDYNTAFERVIGHEGEFQNDPQDRGNWTSGQVGRGKNNGTKFGISAMSYPGLEIRDLTLDDARDIYYRDFWLKVKGDQLHNALAYQLFDAAINHGVRNAVRMLQRAVRVSDDGIVGPVTMGAVNSSDINDVLKRFNAERIRFFVNIPTFDRFGRGWMRRVADNLDYAADDYAAPWHTHLEV